MKRIIGLILIILIPLSVSFLLYAVDAPKSRKGYLLHKYIDTVEITGKHIPQNLYGLTFNLVIKDSITSNQVIKKVSKEDYYSTEPIDSLITYTE